MSNNSTFSNSSSDSHVVIAYLCLASLHILAAFLTVVNLSLILAIRDCTSLPTAIRLIIGNIVLANELFVLALILFAWAESGEMHDPQSYDMYWRVSYVAVCVMSAARLLFMAMYAVMVYVMARLNGSSLGTEKVNMRAMVCAVIIVWLIVLIPNLTHFLTLAYEVNYAVSGICTNSSTVYILDYVLIILPIFGIVCVLFSIIFPILTTHYSKVIILGESGQMLRKMAKFSIFLLLSNVVNFFGVYIPLIFTGFYFYDTCEEFFIALDVVCVGTMIFSLITTPVVMLAFFKSLREHFKKRICFCGYVSVHQFQICFPKN